MEYSGDKFDFHSRANGSLYSNDLFGVALYNQVHHYP